MRNKKLKITVNISFVLLGLTLVFFKLNEGIDSIPDWFSCDH